MSPSAYWFIKLMICFVFLCTFIQISTTQPLFVDDDDDQTQVDNAFLNNYLAAASARLASHIPESSHNYQHHHQQRLFDQNQQYNPDNVQLAKRIIMLPRVGRRSIPSTLHD